jgi:hypothetical protein
MSNETDRPTARPDTVDDSDDVKRPVVPRDPLDTDNVEASVVQGPQRNPAAEIDPDAPGLSALGEQPGDPVEPNEPA